MKCVVEMLVVGKNLYKFKRINQLSSDAFACFLRHETGSCCNSTLHGQNYSKFHTFRSVKSPGLKTSKSLKGVIDIAPNIGNRKWYFSDRHHVIYMKLSWWGLPLIDLSLTCNLWLLSSIWNAPNQLSALWLCIFHRTLSCIYCKLLWSHMNTWYFLERLNMNSA